MKETVPLDGTHVPHPLSSVGFHSPELSTLPDPEVT